MKALLITLGSHGDIHPFIAIGRALGARGHSAVVASNPYFQSQIEASGVGFAALTEREELKNLITRHKVMDAARGPMAVMRKLVLPMVPGFVARTRELIAEIRPDAVVVHPIVIGALWAARMEGVRSVTVCPSPLMWANLNDRCVLVPMRSHEPGAMAVKFDLWLGRAMLRVLMDPGLNRVRRSLGLPARRDNFHLDCVGGDANLGIWSPVLRGPMAGDPAGSVITGFCWHDRDHTQEAPDAELAAFMRAGPRPIVFALGSTGVHAAGRFYEHAVEVTQRLGARALLVVGRDQPPPRNMPRDGSVKAVAYAPFSTVFPAAAAVVHHGGAGTTAQGLRAGRPTVIAPMAHDQFDNAARVRRLGAGVTVRFAKATGPRLEAALRRVLSDGAMARAATGLSERIGREDGAERAAGVVEGVVAGSRVGDDVGSGATSLGTNGDRAGADELASNVTP